MATLPTKENTCGRVVTAFSDGHQKMSNKGGNCVPFEKLHEVMFRLEFETSKAGVGIIDGSKKADHSGTDKLDRDYSILWDRNMPVLYDSKKAEKFNGTGPTDGFNTEEGAHTFKEYNCAEGFSYQNTKFSFRQMAYQWDHLMGGKFDGNASATQKYYEFRPQANFKLPLDYEAVEKTDGNWPLNQRYNMHNRSFCFIDWIGGFSGASLRFDASGTEYSDPYKLFNREIQEAIWNTDIAMSSKKQVVIDNHELWTELERQLTDPVDGNILSALSHAATKHFMRVQSTDIGEDSNNYEQFFARYT